MCLVSGLGPKKDPHQIRNVTNKEHQVLLGLKFSLPLNSKFSLQYGPRRVPGPSQGFESTTRKHMQPGSQLSNNSATKMHDFIGRSGLSSEMSAVLSVSCFCYAVCLLLAIGSPPREACSKATWSDSGSSHQRLTCTPNSPSMANQRCLGGPLKSHQRQNSLECPRTSKRSFLFICIYDYFETPTTKICGPLRESHSARPVLCRSHKLSNIRFVPMRLFVV